MLTFMTATLNLNKTTTMISHYTEVLKRRLARKPFPAIISVKNYHDRDGELWVVHSAHANKDTVALFKLKPKS